MLEALCIKSYFDVSEGRRLELNLDLHQVCLHSVHVNCVLNSLLEIRSEHIRHNFTLVQQFVVKQVLSVAHQKLSTVVNHADHLSLLLI